MSKIKLSTEQVNTVINNICKLRHLTELKEVFNGKPKFTDKELAEYGYEKFGKYADNYRVLIASNNEHSECFIIVDIGKTFEKYTIMACANLLHLFSKQVNTDSEKPMVSICFNSNVPAKQLAEINGKIFNFPYRFIVLPALYFVCGSKTKIGGLTSEYEILPFQPTYNGKDYAVIMSNDPLIIAMNGIPGELFKYSQLLFDTGVYKTVYIKRIQQIPKNPDLPIDSFREDLIIY